MKVEVRRNRSDKKPLIVDYDFGKSTAEAISKFNTEGPYGDVVHELFMVAARMQLREFVLEQHEAKVTGPALIAAIAEWRPRIKHMGKPPLEKARGVVSKLSAEEREALLKELQNGLAAQ